MLKKLCALAIIAVMAVIVMPGEVNAETDANYLTFTSHEYYSSVAFKYKSGAAEYSRDNGETWHDCKAAGDGTGNLFVLSEGETVMFRGTDVTTDNSNHFDIKGKIEASGSVTSLTDGKGVNPDVTLTENCYTKMFINCDGLITAPELPATKLAVGCYSHMFYSCSSLTSCPELPATEVPEDGYAYMFAYCRNLKVAPVLPADEVGEGGYGYMFNNCSNIETIPEMPVISFGRMSCLYMFCNTGVKLSEEKNESYMFTWKPGITGTVTGERWSMYFMKDTGGTFTGDIATGNTYYQATAVVRFNTNGGSELKPLKVSSDNPYVSLTEETVKDGYILEGWYRDRKLTLKYDLSEPVEMANNWLYAKWVKDITLENVQLKTQEYTYTGAVKTPEVTVDGLTAGTDYIVTYKDGRKNAGKYSVTVEGRGSYGGTVTKYFTIKKATPAVKITTASKTVKYTAVKKKTVETAALAVSGAKGTKKFAKVSGSSKLSITSTGKIKVKKGTKKGTYTIKVKVTSAATTNYMAKTSPVKTIKVKVA